MATTESSPASGFLASSHDLEQIMSLDDWLNHTEAMRKDRKLADAWAEGNTNCAFAFNSTMGVEKSHASNVWVSNWQNPDVPTPTLDRDGHGLYVYMPNPPVLLQRLNEPHTTSQSFPSDEIHNDGDEPTTETRAYDEEQGEEVSISSTTSIGFSAKGGFEMEGFSFEVSTSFDHSDTQSKTRNNMVKMSQSISVPLPAKKITVFTWATFTTVQDLRYGLDVKLGEESPDGSLGLATTFGQRGNWNTFLKLSEVLAHAGHAGAETQRILYKITKTTKLTKIYIGQKEANGEISWVGEHGAPPS